MPRLAWFSPMPPVATGVARCSADLVRDLRADFDIDVYVHDDAPAAPLRSAHDFVWRQRQRPYDLTVYQLGNSSHHDYQWPYLFRYPGLVVLHDAHLHHARAACLLRAARRQEYRTEFAWNHPDANPDLAEVAVKGFDSHLLYEWPMIGLVVTSARMVAVHTPAIADDLRAAYPDARVEAIHLGHGRLLTPDESAALGRCARARYEIPDGAVVFGCYGGLTPDKRLPQIIAAFAATVPFVPGAQLLLAGAVPEHYDLQSDLDRHGVSGRTTLTGYLNDDDAFTECIAACDVALNLRWPTAREVSGPWLRCLAAGKPTVIVDLEHLGDVPTIDPRTWQPNVVCARGMSTDRSGDSAPCAVAIDIVDEDHSLRLAMRRLGTDASLRASLGAQARIYWSARHAIEVMTSDYRRLIATALAADATASRTAVLPPHVLDDGSGTLRAVMTRFGLAAPWTSDATPLR